MTNARLVRSRSSSTARALIKRSSSLPGASGARTLRLLRARWNGLSMRWVMVPRNATTGRWGIKTYAFLHPPYLTTVWLDCDTIVMQPNFLPNMRSFVRHADLAMGYDWPISSRRLVPPVFNTGLVSWKESALTHSFFRAVHSRLSDGPPLTYYAAGRRWSDQEAIHLELADRTATQLGVPRVSVLPPEYTCNAIPPYR